MDEVERLAAEQGGKLGAEGEHPADQVAVGAAEHDLADAGREGPGGHVARPGGEQHQRAEVAAQGAGIGLDVGAGPLGGGDLVERDVQQRPRWPGR